MKRIVTHTAPDWDAITAVWLLKRYGGFERAQVHFVNTGSPDAELLASADAIVDTGGEYDPERYRFDHHQLPGNEATSTCAALQVFTRLLRDQAHLIYLNPLIDLVTAGDIGSRDFGAAYSRQVGIHAILRGMYHPDGRHGRMSDTKILIYCSMLLDDLDIALKARHNAAQSLDSHLVYRSDDGLVVALRDAPREASTVAFEYGARLVVFSNSIEVPGGTTHAIGIQRAQEWTQPHVGHLVECIFESVSTGQFARAYAPETGVLIRFHRDALAAWRPVADEMSTWFLHNGGFFAGRGTEKAPRFDPVTVDVALVARAIDAAWVRSESLTSWFAPEAEMAK